MACSLIKYERIQTTEAKAKSLGIVMKKVFDILYSTTIPEERKKLELRKIVWHHGAYMKLQENLKNKLSNSREREFTYNFSRIRKGDGARVFMVELDKNDKKRKQQKEEKYFSQYYNNPAYDINVFHNRQRLHELYSQHLLMSNILKKNYSDIEQLLVNKKKLTRSELFSINNSNFEKITPEIRDLDIQDMMNDVVKFCGETPKNGYEYLLLFDGILSKLNSEINSVKNSLGNLLRLQDHKGAVEKYNNLIYENYYAKEKKKFREIFKNTYKEIQNSKEGIRKILKEKKNKEQAEKKKINLIFSSKTNAVDELTYNRHINHKNKKHKEYMKTYSRHYLTGEESGFSDLDELENKPKSLVHLRKALNKGLIEETKKGRTVFKANKRL
eukprot:CAMPEP_0170516790 /NCGR_PEP_ID=MMETSP0209-20121228/2926_1 /TAXON_ID=665100 ORGANISM="Litonotus pictus, Strain P1" /NCGR_SAMPLE_ID=MMETSP0209 /ASSEMBLY_ACC=CAM_ASM_000301 /LENGTH=385 /DNA_ID=CAMNT_0010801821 /DNA_START=74 /DNA_END=1231 /DNA_ORIENTATION=+